MPIHTRAAQRERKSTRAHTLPAPPVQAPRPPALYHKPRPRALDSRRCADCSRYGPAPRSGACVGHYTYNAHYKPPHFQNMVFELKPFNRGRCPTYPNVPYPPHTFKSGR